MLNFSSWLTEGGDLAGNPTNTVQQRAALAWRRINDKPTSVTFRTAAGASIAAQTVRIEYASSAAIDESAAGATPVMRVIIFGVRGHATIANTDIKEGYRVVVGTDEYRCVDVILTIGEIQGIFQAAG